MLANMLKLVMTLGLVGLAASIDDDPFDILRTLGIYPSNHVTVSTRVKQSDAKLFNGPHYFMSSGQCEAYLNTSRLCGNEAVDGLEVRVSDPLDFAIVVLDMENGEARIQRRGPDNNLYCRGVALVDLRLTCDHWVFSHSRNRPRLPSLDSDSSSSSKSRSDYSSSYSRDESEAEEHEDRSGETEEEAQ